MAEQQFIYDAFISYRHLPAEKAVAARLQRLLEGHRDKNGRRLRLFRDQSELPTSSDLGQDIRKALEQSRFLIVVCSPAYQQSKWCMEELSVFRALHGGTNRFILPILVEGEPAESFPEELKWEDETVTLPDGSQERHRREVEPLGADVRGDTERVRMKRLKTEYYRIAAPILGCKYDDLYQRFQRQLRGRIIAVSALVVAAALAFAAYSSYMLSQIAAKQQQIYANESRRLANEAISMMEEDPSLAALLADTALPEDLGDPDYPIVQEALLAVNSTALQLDIQNWNSVLRSIGFATVEQKNWKVLGFSADGAQAVIQSGNGYHIYDMREGVLLSKVDQQEAEALAAPSNISDWYFVLRTGGYGWMNQDFLAVREVNIAIRERYGEDWSYTVCYHTPDKTVYFVNFENQQTGEELAAAYHLEEGRFLGILEGQLHAVGFGNLLYSINGDALGLHYYWAESNPDTSAYEEALQELTQLPTRDPAGILSKNADRILFRKLPGAENTDCVLSIYDTADMADPIFSMAYSQFMPVVYSADMRYVMLSPSKVLESQVYCVDTGELMLTIPQENALTYNRNALSEDGAYLAVLEPDGNGMIQVDIYDVQAGERTKTFEVREFQEIEDLDAPIPKLSFRGSALYIYWQETGEYRVCDLASGEVREGSRAEAGGETDWMDPDWFETGGCRVVTGEDGCIEVLRRDQDSEEQLLTRIVPHGERTVKGCDGSYLVLYGEGRTEVYDLTDGSLTYVIPDSNGTPGTYTLHDGVLYDLRTGQKGPIAAYSLVDTAVWREKLRSYLGGTFTARSLTEQECEDYYIPNEWRPESE